MHIDAGEVVSLLGRNGVGRSTTVKAIMGEVAAAGLDQIQGHDIVGFTELFTGSRIWGWATFRSIAISSLA